MPSRFRNYWVYSIGVAVAWGVVLVIVSAKRSDKLSAALLVFAGFAIGWVSSTIARYVYPPPEKWHPHEGLRS